MLGVQQGKEKGMKYLGSPALPSKLFIQLGASTTSLSGFGSVVATIPASHISPSSWATTS